MTKILAQHGTAKGQKIDIAMENQFLSGVIFSPREEVFDSIKRYCDTNSLMTPQICFIDPQLYYSTFEGKIFKHLEDGISYPQKITRRDWRKRTSNLMGYLDAHAENSASISNSLITPGFYIQNLDWHFDYSIDIYEYCYETYTMFDKYYLSLLISNNFFHSKTDVDEMLEDIIDNVDHKEGIYFSICYENVDEKNYEYIDAQNLANILYFIYSLKNAGFSIVTGYTFLNSLLFAMLDCEYVASGWFNNIRKFNKIRFEDVSTTGRRKKRYTSLPLLTYITFENLNIMDGIINIEEFLSGCGIDDWMIDRQDSISFVDLEQQYWEAISIFIGKLNNQESLQQKINFMLSEIEHAKDVYNDILESLSTDKIAYNRIKNDSKHLDSWMMGIETFKNRISLL